MAKMTKEQILQKQREALEDNLQGFAQDLNQTRTWLTVSGKIKRETLLVKHLQSEIKAQRAIDQAKEAEE